MNLLPTLFSAVTALALSASSVWAQTPPPGAVVGTVTVTAVVVGAVVVAVAVGAASDNSTTGTTGTTGTN